MQAISFVVLIITAVFPFLLLHLFITRPTKQQLPKFLCYLNAYSWLFRVSSFYIYNNNDKS